MLDRYRFVDGKKLRCGYTTGTCSAAAAKGAAIMLLSGDRSEYVTIKTAGDTVLTLPLEDVVINSEEENSGLENGKAQSRETVCCAVRKDAGDDKDVTDGILVYATVKKTSGRGIKIDGGKGVGRVTRKGMNQPVGEAAINSGPRESIRGALEEVCAEYHYEGGFEVLIEVPEGEEIAKKTFNPRLGIEGGISILGTTGIVEPMSEQALIDTIRVEIQMKAAEGKKYLLVTPGNYGMDYVKGNTSLSPELAIKCSNFIGDTIDMAVEAGFEKMLLIGHIGKMVKLGSGIMNTHSKYADGRMETLAVCGIEAGLERAKLNYILSCNTTKEAVEYLEETGDLGKVMDCLMKRIEYNLELRTYGKMEIAAVVFSEPHGLLGMTTKAEEMLKIDGGF